MTLTDPVRLRELRGQLGPTDAPAEDQLAEAFETIASEGAQRLHRTWREMIPTGPGGWTGGGHRRAGVARRLPARSGWLGALSGSG
jgi:hypothetical protein